MLTLVIADKNLSSWSMRPWLALKKTGAPFDEVMVRLKQPTTASEIAKHSPSGKVPVLKDGALAIWESIAICEHLAERFPDAQLWPADAAERAVARSVVSEMHAGFTALRSEMPCNVTLRTTKAPSEAVRKDVARLTSVFRTLRAEHAGAGPYLFGRWSIADAFFTPVATRFRTYGVALGDETAEAYCAALLADEAFLVWERDAIAEVSGA
jgi:glutathione S-transferase